MAEQYEIKFWAHQFYEHFFLIESIFRRNDLLDDEMTQQLREMQNQWVHVQKSGNEDDNLIDLINQTRVMKDLIEQTVRDQELPCLPDLLLHMKEELKYFHDAILNQEMTFSEEMKWWAQEHSDSLDFDNCQLPVFVEEDSLVANIIGHPEALDKISHENANISALFTELQTENDEEILYQQLMTLKAKHLDALTTAIYSVESLPLEEETKKIVYSNLKHASAEAEFAFQRLEKLRTTK